VARGALVAAAAGDPRLAPTLAGDEVAGAVDAAQGVAVALLTAAARGEVEVAGLKVIEIKMGQGV
jgi:hypothetical protein